MRRLEQFVKTATALRASDAQISCNGSNSSIANQPMSPAVAAEWRQLYRDLKRTKAQLIGQMRRLGLLIEQTATIVGEIEKGRIYVATIEKPVDAHSDSVRAVE